MLNYMTVILKIAQTDSKACKNFAKKPCSSERALTEERIVIGKGVKNIEDKKIFYTWHKSFFLNTLHLVVGNS